MNKIILQVWDKMVEKLNAEALREALKEILESNDSPSTQEEICQKLTSMGFKVTQSTVSRMLKKIGATKTSIQGSLGYILLESEFRQPLPTSEIKEQVVSCEHNYNMIVLRTSPGSASLIARLLDYHFGKKFLGSIAGDDTIFLAPKSVEQIGDLHEDIAQFLRLR
ncbi:arginine repressor [Chlamydiifrater phoenicopteri]|uniref:arginine repressor n=1 Tax=Chlamydiifrater phoenicopteri TaxID=2681469 RepID=UPI001BCDED2D|nr:arginine repressor [Chlamydiifrater phoenicopteri]